MRTVHRALLLIALLGFLTPPAAAQITSVCGNPDAACGVGIGGLACNLAKTCTCGLRAGTTATCFCNTATGGQCPDYISIAPAAPAVSREGAVALTLLLIITGTTYLIWRRPRVTAS